MAEKKTSKNEEKAVTKKETKVTKKATEKTTAKATTKATEKKAGKETATKAKTTAKVEKKPAKTEEKNEKAEKATAKKETKVANKAKKNSNASENHVIRQEISSDRIRIRLKAYDHVILEQSAERIVDTSRKTGAKVTGPIPLPTEKEITTIIRSPHKHKDSREQFELRTHKRVIDIHYPTQKTVDSIAKIELPAGVDIEVKY